MNLPELRVNPGMRDTVDAAIQLLGSKGASATAAFLYRYGVPAAVIERVLSRYRMHSASRLRDLNAGQVVLLSDVLATYELAIREPRLPPRSKTNVETWPLPEKSLDAIVANAREALGADAVGISLFNQGTDELTWAAIAGELAPFQGRRFPRRHSMCDICFQTSQSQLFLNPHLYFAWMAMNGIFVNEALITPLRGQSQFVFGTLWAVATATLNEQFTASHLGLLKLHASEIPAVLRR